MHRGDPLFIIDPRPFQIRLEQAVAQFQTAQARERLSEAELWRAQQLKRTDFGTAESVDQRAAEQRSQQAAIDTAQAAIRDAQLDLEFARVTAPFTGRIGAHLVSVGSLVSGSRGGASSTTLLATIVSLDPIYLDFDMSEADYNNYLRNHGQHVGAEKVGISLADAMSFDREGTLDFIDNALDRSSGTIHARALVSNSNLQLTPGGFARVRLSVAKPAPVLLVPDASVLPDQSTHFVLTVGKDGTVAPKQVELGELRGGLRVIRSGLEASDEVVVDSLPLAHPGAKVAPHEVQLQFAEDGKTSEPRLAKQ